jgi:hypothetical protein
MITLSALGQIAFTVEAADSEAVFIRDMPASRPASQAPHIGLATLEAWLNPILPGGTRYAVVRLPSGRSTQVAACHVCAADRVASIRLRPGIHGTPRSAVA